jgi:cation transport ATPase
MLKPTLVSIVALDGHDEGALLALAAGAASGLQAPLGTALVESARSATSRLRRLTAFTRQSPPAQSHQLLATRLWSAMPRCSPASGCR